MEQIHKTEIVKIYLAKDLLKQEIVVVKIIEYKSKSIY